MVLVAFGGLRTPAVRRRGHCPAAHLVAAAGPGAGVRAVHLRRLERGRLHFGRAARRPACDPEALLAAIAVITGCTWCSWRRSTSGWVFEGLKAATRGRRGGGARLRPVRADTDATVVCLSVLASSNATMIVGRAPITRSGWLADRVVHEPLGPKRDVPVAAFLVQGAITLALVAFAAYEQTRAHDRRIHGSGVLVLLSADRHFAVRTAEEVRACGASVPVPFILCSAIFVVPAAFYSGQLGMRNRNMRCRSPAGVMP